jgi:hypothetical protein
MKRGLIVAAGVAIAAVVLTSAVGTWFVWRLIRNPPRPAPPNDQPNWHVEENARPSKTHPLAGFWKPGDCAKDGGLAIGPMGESTYYVSFCGPGGCFAEGTYRPETTIVGDPTYRLLDPTTLEVVGWLGISQKYVKCPGRLPER